MGLKVGVTRALTVMDMDAFEAHCPGFAVKLKLNVPALLVLMVEGLHVPVTGVELLEEVGREGAVVD
jgi:hypothetical protein